MATILQFQYYAAVVRQQGFTAAAETLFVSQPALSKSIRALEKEFRAELIDRQAKTFRLTPEGELLYEYALNILEHFQSQINELHQRLDEAGGELRFGLPPTAGSIFFYSCLERFARLYPHTDLKLTEVPSKTITELLEAKKLDIGCVLEPFRDSAYHVKPVFSSELMLLVSNRHRLAGRKSVALAELRGESFLMMSSDYMFHDLVLNYCREAGFEPNVAFESSQWDLVFELAANNQGVTFFCKPLLEKQLLDRVEMIPLEDPMPPWTLSLAYRKDKFITPQMQHFLDVCIPG